MRAILLSLLKTLTKVFAGVIAGLTLLAGVLAVQLVGAKQVSIAFLTPYLEKAFDYSDAGFRIRVSDTVLSWEGWESNIDISSVGVELLTTEGRIVATFPKANISLSFDGLMHGLIALETVQLSGANITAIRKENGDIDFGLILNPAAGNAGNGVPQSLVLDDWLEEIIQGNDKTSPLGYLKTIAIVDAKARLVDRINGKTWEAPRADIALTKGIDRIFARMALELYVDQQLTNLSGSGQYRLATKSMDLKLVFDDLRPKVFSQVIPELKELERLDVPISGIIDLDIEHPWTLAAINLKVAADSGGISIPEYYADPFPVEGISFDASMTGGFDTVTVKNLRLLSRGVTFTGDAALRLKDFNPTELALNLDIAGMTIKQLDHFWPVNAAKDAREWCVPNLKAGTVTSATLALKMTEKQLKGEELPEKVQFDFSFKDAVVDYLHPLPPLTEGQGRATITATDFVLNASGGNVGDIRMQEGQLVINGLSDEDQFADIQFVGNGPVQDILKLINNKPLELLSAFKALDVNNVSGTGSVSASLFFPLLKELPAEKVKVSARGIAQDLGIKQVIPDVDLLTRQAKIEVNNDQLHVSGDILLNDVPLAMQWDRSFNGSDVDVYKLSGHVNSAQRQALKLPDLSAYLKGDTNVSATISDYGKRTVFDLSASVDDATVTVDLLDYRKLAGEPGQVVGQLVMQGDQIAVPRFRFLAGNMATKGKAQFNAANDNPLDWLKLEELTYNGHDFAMDVQQAANRYDVKITGRRFDAKHFLTDWFSDPNAVPAEFAVEETQAKAAVDPSQELNLDIAVDRLQVSQDHFLQGFTMKGSQKGEDWQDLMLRGQFDNDWPLYVSIKPGKPQERALLLTAQNGGALLKALGYIDGIAGGNLKIAGVYDDTKDGHPLNGAIDFRTFRLVNTPIMARILTLGSLSGMVDTLRGEGVAFDRLTMDFVHTPETFSFKDMFSAGSALTFTGEGVINSELAELDVKGAIFPASMINSALAKIPLLGDILSGGDKAGVFGFAYRVYGKNQDPSVFVNPLSVVAPGILRRLIPVFGSGGDVEDPAAAAKKAQQKEADSSQKN